MILSMTILQKKKSQRHRFQFIAMLRFRVKKMDKNTPEGNSHSELIIYAGLACTRIFLALAPQTGYIHPDEYFQSLEVVLGSKSIM